MHRTDAGHLLGPLHVNRLNTAGRTSFRSAFRYVRYHLVSSLEGIPTSDWSPSLNHRTLEMSHESDAGGKRTAMCASIGQSEAMRICSIHAAECNRLQNQSWSSELMGNRTRRAAQMQERKPGSQQQETMTGETKDNIQDNRRH